MKVLLSCGKDTYGSGASFARALRKLGVEVVTFFDDATYEASFPRLKNKYTHRLAWKWFSSPVRQKFREAIRKEAPDLVLVFKGMFFSPTFLKVLKKDFPKLLFFCFNPDNPFDRHYYGVSNNWIRSSIPFYDAYFIWGKFLLPLLTKAGAKHVEYIPFGYDPDIHYPVVVSDAERDFYGSQLAFIGSWDKEREKLVRPLLRYDLKIWGNGWHKAPSEVRQKWQKKAVTGEEFAKVCASTDIIIDFLRPHMAPAHTMKIFEIAGSGGFLLSSCGGEFADFFERDKEFDCFGHEDMLKKIDFFLAHPDERKAMARAIHLKVGLYSYEKRVQPIIDAYNKLRAIH